MRIHYLVTGSHVDSRGSKWQEVRTGLPGQHQVPMFPVLLFLLSKWPGAFLESVLLLTLAETPIADVLLPFLFNLLSNLVVLHKSLAISEQSFMAKPFHPGPAWKQLALTNLSTCKLLSGRSPCLQAVFNCQEPLKLLPSQEMPFDAGPMSSHLASLGAHSIGLMVIDSLNSLLFLLFWLCFVCSDYAVCSSNIFRSPIQLKENSWSSVMVGLRECFWVFIQRGLPHVVTLGIPRVLLACRA